MAQRIAENLEEATHPPIRYPWHEWTDGAVWAVRRGEDFYIDPGQFRVTLAVRASRIGKRVRVRVDGDVVKFQFYTPAA
ncbi:hypothetical protein [Frankia sp. KB5]|uniref:hypothetical protein n=1 Tax=Frankia sp. KB5 TaxID=683318 RepID=UPI000A11AA28|nr:hypothetical protein [Frankia sp. KB5]ORT48408.1 hypothetical protein KBI5_15755 [Frankia sp. KB5]